MRQQAMFNYMLIQYNRGTSTSSFVFNFQNPNYALDRYVIWSRFNKKLDGWYEAYTDGNQARLNSSAQVSSISERWSSIL